MRHREQKNDIWWSVAYQFDDAVAAIDFDLLAVLENRGDVIDSHHTWFAAFTGMLLLRWVVHYS